jgi:hypothetical protein
MIPPKPQNKLVKNIRVNYDDGSRHTFDRGFVCRPDPERGENSWVLEFANVTYADLKQILNNAEAMIDELRAQVTLLERQSELTGNPKLTRLFIGGNL